MKILVTGANGILGSTIVSSMKGAEIIALNRSDLDITDARKVSVTIQKHEPNIIIHTAANTDVEGNERDPEKAFAVNTTGVSNIVTAISNSDILLIFISSAGIYGTQKTGPFNESDEAIPTTIHHKSKNEAEKIIKARLQKYLILRTGWLFGGDINHTKNFIYKRYLEAKNRKTIYSDDTQVGNPTYVMDVVRQIEVLVKRECSGVYNCVNAAKNVSRFEYVSKIIKLLGLDCSVLKAPEGMFKRIAPVSHNESAVNARLENEGINIMRKWDQALSDYIQLMKSSL